MTTNLDAPFSPSYHLERAERVIEQSVEFDKDDALLECETWKTYFHILKEVFPFMQATAIRSRYLKDRVDIFQRLQHN